MLKSISVAVLSLAILASCQKEGQQQMRADEQTAATRSDAPPPRPPMRQTDARVMIGSASAARGQSGSFDVRYYGIEPLKAIVVPISYPHGMKIDSVSFAGSMIEYVATRPVRIDNDSLRALISAIPMTEPLIPAGEGLLATFHFTLSGDAASGPIEEGFIPPANYLVYIDSASTEAEPIFEPGQLTVESAP